MSIRDLEVRRESSRQQQRFPLNYADFGSVKVLDTTSKKLTVTNNYLSSGETWVFSGTEVDGVAAGLVLFKIVDIVGGGAITDADFTTHGEVV